MRRKARQLLRVYTFVARSGTRKEEFSPRKKRWHSLHKSASNKIRKTRGGRGKETGTAKVGGGGGRKGDRKRNRGMNLFMDGAGSSGDGRASGGINAKLAIHTKSAWVQVKRGEYISPGINLFELGLHWNNWTLQRAMISECSCGRRERERDGGRRQIYRPSGSVEDPRGAE